MGLLPDLQRWLDEAAERHGMPGAAIAVGVGDELAEAATGVLNARTGVETTTDSLFQIGSVSKVWTAALVLQLAGEGLVELDAPVRRYLPEFAVADAAATATVTVRQLLSHTGGFVGDLFEDTGRGDDAVNRLLEFMHAGATQVSAPGELFSYCNAGFCVLGALVAKLRGGTWESAMRDRLIGPLGSTHMALFAEEAIVFRAAVGHPPRSEGPRRIMPRWQLPRSNAPAGATQCAAPRELVRFGRMLLADGLAEDGSRVLPAGAFAAMREPQIGLPRISEQDPTGWGLGLALFDWDGVAVVGHDGGTIAQLTCWRIVPDRNVVIALSLNGVPAAAFADDVLTPVLAEVAGIRLPRPPVPPAELAPFRPDPYVGTFAGPLAAFEVSAADGGLEVTRIPQGLAAAAGDQPDTTRYVALGDDRFIAAEPQDGAHPTFCYLQGGRYLVPGLRVLPRVAG